MDNYNMLQDKLTGFESAWQLVHLKCSQLLADVELAQTFTTVCITPFFLTLSSRSILLDPRSLRSLCVTGTIF